MLVCTSFGFVASAVYSASEHPLYTISCLQLASIGVQNEETNRRELREFLFTAPGVADCISGVVRASCCIAG